jgi:hypothetical protein
MELSLRRSFTEAAVRAMRSVMNLMHCGSALKAPYAFTA